LIRESEREGCELDGLPLASFKAAHSLFGDDVLDWLDPHAQWRVAMFRRYRVRLRFSAQLRSAREALRPATDAARGNELVLRAV